MMTLGGGRAIITLRVANRDRGRWCGCQRSWEVTMWNDHRKWLVVTSSCHLTLQTTETWAMIGCCGNVWDLLTSVNDPDHFIRMAYVGHPDVLCEPSGWYVYKCRLIFLEVVRKSMACVLYRKIRMRVTRMTMRAMCHCKMRATCSRREGSLQSLLLVPITTNTYISPSLPTSKPMAHVP